MAKCKVVVRRFTAGLDFIGDCVNAYPFEMQLGNLVEPQGGAFVIIEVNNATFNDPEIQEILSSNENPTTHNKIYGLRPVSEGDEFFTELLTNGRINVALEKLLEYKIKH
tara:strand:+ start:62 stop:391 length:330 start_codon:yes stop_codon:yes gene_type:complete